MSPLLLDTCAVLWLMNAEPMSDEARRAIDSAAARRAVLVSPITAWEVALLASKGRIAFSLAPEAWFEAVLALPGVGLAPMPPRTLIASAFLPGDPPNDPADRIIAATARAENFVVTTRDHKLRTYGERGHIRVLVC